MMHAYDKIYLEKAQTSLARMLDFAVHDLGYDIDEFFDNFISSGVAARFGKGDFRLIAGKSGVELAYDVLEINNITFERIKPSYVIDRSTEFWAGWALAYYQWYTGLSFKEIVKTISISNIMLLYSPYHEMDIKHFVDKMNEIYKTENVYSNLKNMRLRVGLSQSQLAEQTNIPIRTIQQYEQRQKDINNAKVDYLIRLSNALYCDVELLLERVK